MVVGAPIDPPPPGDSVDEVIRTTSAALEDGYTHRHQADLAEPLG